MDDSSSPNQGERVVLTRRRNNRPGGDREGQGVGAVSVSSRSSSRQNRPIARSNSGSHFPQVDLPPPLIVSTGRTNVVSSRSTSIPRSSSRQRNISRGVSGNPSGSSSMQLSSGRDPNVTSSVASAPSTTQNTQLRDSDERARSRTSRSRAPVTYSSRGSSRARQHFQARESGNASDSSAPVNRRARSRSVSLTHEQAVKDVPEHVSRDVHSERVSRSRSNPRERLGQSSDNPRRRARSMSRTRLSSSTSVGSTGAAPPSKGVLQKPEQHRSRSTSKPREASRKRVSKSVASAPAIQRDAAASRGRHKSNSSSRQSRRERSVGGEPRTRSKKTSKSSRTEAERREQRAKRIKDIPTTINCASASDDQDGRENKHKSQKHDRSTNPSLDCDQENVQGAENQQSRDELISEILQGTEAMINGISGEGNAISLFAVEAPTGNEKQRSPTRKTSKRQISINRESFSLRDNPAVPSAPSKSPRIGSTSEIPIAFATVVPMGDADCIVDSDVCDFNQAQADVEDFFGNGDCSQNDVTEAAYLQEVDENNRFAHDAGLMFTNGVYNRNDNFDPDEREGADCGLDIIQDDMQLRYLASKLSRKWGTDLMTPAVARRVRDFQFAQKKRQVKYGDSEPWGIMGLYEHLSAVRTDVEWAEDAAWRRFHNEPYITWAEFDEKKRTRLSNKPFFTYLLLLGCTCMFIASMAENEWEFEPFSVNPTFGPSAETLVDLGAKDSNLIVNHGQTWRLVTAMFLHAGVVHYALNMAALLMVGGAVEKSHGFVAAAVLFTVPAIGGTILSALILPQYVSVGASGGIFGLIGACLADIVMNFTLLFGENLNGKKKRLRNAVVLLLLFLDMVLNCLVGLTPFVDNFQHMGGLVYGFLCAFSTMERLSMDFFGIQTSKTKCSMASFSRVTGLIASVAAIMTTIILLLEGDGMSTGCVNCQVLSCVPMPPWGAVDNKWWYCDSCDQITASATVNQDTGFVVELALICPNAQHVDVTVGDGVSEEEAQLKLPSFCRNFCDTTF
jgi:membrane associated rhomboid family serine protease